MLDLAELKQQRDAARDEIFALRDVVLAEQREFTPDEARRWDEANDTYHHRSVQIDEIELADPTHNVVEAPSPSPVR